MSLRRSTLDQVHRDLGARMVEFGGWEMPLSYPDGTLAEHRRCRTAAVVFDVSHLGTVRLEGPSAHGALQWHLSNDLDRIAPGRAQYTHLLDDDASVLDDIIVWWLAPEEFMVLPNASNTARVIDALGGEDLTATRALLAVQGPRSRSVAGSVVAGVDSVGRFEVAARDWEDTQVVVAGTGYTGEDGVELAVPGERAELLWSQLAAAGARPAGLGARDTLRLEAGLPLHGHELGPGITPLQAGMGWVVGWSKDDFRGRQALRAEREQGPRRRLRGIVLDGRQPPREGCRVLCGDRPVGTVTSGNYSPVLERGIGLAFLGPDIALGDEVGVEVRSRMLPGRVVRTPFVTASRPAAAT